MAKVNSRDATVDGSLPLQEAREASDERALIRDAIRGSSKAKEVLVRRHWPSAHRAAYLIVQDAGAAEDIAQEAFLSAFGSLSRFDRRQKFKPWLHRIVANRAIDWHRARQRRAEVELTEVGGESTAPQTDASVIAAMGQLELEDRAIVVLRHLFGYSATEIARMLDRSPSTVRTQLQRALERLREELS